MAAVRPIEPHEVLAAKPYPFSLRVPVSKIPKAPYKLDGEELGRVWQLKFLGSDCSDPRVSADEQTVRRAHDATMALEAETISLKAAVGQYGGQWRQYQEIPSLYVWFLYESIRPLPEGVEKEENLHYASHVVFKDASRAADAQAWLNDGTARRLQAVPEDEKPLYVKKHKNLAKFEHCQPSASSNGVQESAVVLNVSPLGSSQPAGAALVEAGPSQGEASSGSSSSTEGPADSNASESSDPSPSNLSPSSVDGSPSSSSTGEAEAAKTVGAEEEAVVADGVDAAAESEVAAAVAEMQAEGEAILDFLEEWGLVSSAEFASDEVAPSQPAEGESISGSLSSTSQVVGEGMTRRNKSGGKDVSPNKPVVGAMQPGGKKVCSEEKVPRKLFDEADETMEPLVPVVSVVTQE